MAAGFVCSSCRYDDEQSAYFYTIRARRGSSTPPRTRRFFSAHIFLGSGPCPGTVCLPWGPAAPCWLHSALVITSTTNLAAGWSAELRYSSLAALRDEITRRHPGVPGLAEASSRFPPKQGWFSWGRGETGDASLAEQRRVSFTAYFGEVARSLDRAGHQSEEILLTLVQDLGYAVDEHTEARVPAETPGESSKPASASPLSATVAASSPQHG